MIYKNGWNVSYFQQKFLFFTANLTAISSFIAHSLSSHISQKIPIYSIWIASLLYWHNPLQNWRRNLDIYVSHFGISFYILCLIYYKPKFWLLSCFGIGFSAFIFRHLSLKCSNELEKIHNYSCENENNGIYFCPKKHILSWKSVLYHSGIHVFTNLFASLSLYFYTL
jgi:hypothetical protein